MVDWQVIIKKHGPAVWQTSYRLLGNHADTAGVLLHRARAKLRESFELSVKE